MSNDPVEIEREKERVFGACGGKCGEAPCIEWNKAHRARVPEDMREHYRETRAEVLAENRIRIGNTPMCDECHQPQDRCICGDLKDQCAICGGEFEAPIHSVYKDSHQFTIDITPVGCQTPEGVKRVKQAQNEWDSATHAVANMLKELLDCGVTLNTDGKVDREAAHQLRALIGARDAKQEAFLRAVAGR